MGDRNANRGGGLEGSPTKEMMLIPEAVSPDGLRARAGIMRERGDESCARHIELAAQALEQKEALLGQAAEKLGEAADTINRLNAARQQPKNPLEDPELQAHCYRTDMDTDSKQVRILFFRDRNQQRLLGYMLMDSPEVYDVASTLMRKYDKLEGIE